MQGSELSMIDLFINNYFEEIGIFLDDNNSWEILFDKETINDPVIIEDLNLISR